MELTYQFTTRCPAQKALVLAGNFDHLQAWDNTVTTVNRLSGTEASIGSQWNIELQFARRRAHMTYEIVNHEPGARLVAIGKNSAIHTCDTLSVVPLTTGCRFTYQITLNGQGWRAWLNPLWYLLFRPSANRAARALQQWLDTIPH